MTSSNKTPMERAVEMRTGRTIEEIRRTPVDVLRRRAEQRFGRPIRFEINSPIIGRGNVLGAKSLSAVEINTILDEAIADAEQAD